MSGSDNEERRTFKRCLLTAVTRAPPPPPPGAGGGRFEAAAAAAAPDVRVRLLGRVVGVAAAAGPPKSIVHNGNVYKSLADHDPYCRTAINEYDKLYDLYSAWQICPKTPDALHVCANYPWASYALVFADGSAHWTSLAPTLHNPFPFQPRQPGQQADKEGCLRQEGGRYGIDRNEKRFDNDVDVYAFDPSYLAYCDCCDVLLVRKL